MTARGFAGRHGRRTLVLAGCAAAAIGAGLLRPPGIADAQRLRISTFAALASAAIVAILIVPFVFARLSRAPRSWTMAVAALTAVAGIASFVVSARVQQTCTAPWSGTIRIIGSQLTPSTVEYAAVNPHASAAELLFDAQGRAELVWTAESIARCRTRIVSTYFTWVPCLIAALLVAVLSISSGTLPAAAARTSPSPAPGTKLPVRYDVFLSYRHGGQDTDVARHLLETLEAEGYRVAIDERDFLANASFLEEMDRCIRESRFTVAIVSPRYFESGNTQEEAIICKVLDMGERRRRLIPFIIAGVQTPTWMYGIVGIDATRADALVDPIDRLRGTIGPPMGRADAI